MKRYEYKTFSNITLNDDDLEIKKDEEEIPKFGHFGDLSDFRYIKSMIETEKLVHEQQKAEEDEEIAKFKMKTFNKSLYIDPTPIISSNQATSPLPALTSTAKAIEPIIKIKSKKRKLSITDSHSTAASPPSSSSSLTKTIPSTIVIKKDITDEKQLHTNKGNDTIEKVATLSAAPVNDTSPHDIQSDDNKDVMKDNNDNNNNNKLQLSALPIYYEDSEEEDEEPS